MRKQMIQFLAVILVLIVCIGGYFAVTHYSDKKEKEESREDTIEAFKIDNDVNIVGLTYTYEGKEISLSKDDDKWTDTDDSGKKLDGSTIESEMLIPLSKIEASQKIEKPEDTAEYGFETNDKGVITPKTNTIIATDSDNNTYTIYIGTANPYDSSKYYMMVAGDDNVYVIDSTVVDAFSKAVDDLEEETTTAEETTAEEVTSEDSEK